MGRIFKYFVASIFGFLAFVFLAMLAAQIVDPIIPQNLFDGSTDGNEGSISYLGMGIGSLIVILIGLLVGYRSFFKTQKTKRIALGLVIASAAAVCSTVVITSNLNSGDNQSSSPNKLKKSDESSMPPLFGMNLDKAIEEIKARYSSIDRDVELSDLVGEREVNDYENWVVADQAPPSGTTIKSGQMLCLGVRKVNEVGVELINSLESPCPVSPNNVWPPIGFEKTQDKAIVMNLDFPPGGQPYAKDCKVEDNRQVFVSNSGRGEGRQSIGSRGRCYYFQFLLKRDCHQVQMRFQWLTSTNLVIGLSTTWSDVSVPKSSKVNLTAFLPREAWNLAIGGGSIYEISCISK